MRHAAFAIAIAALCSLALPAVAQQAQDTRLRGSFVPTRSPEGDARPATGEVRAMVEADGDARVDLVVSGLAERATTATLHTGDAGENGEQVARMELTVDGAEARVIGATTRLSPIVAAQVRAGQAYVVVRTNEHPDGVLRAQLVPQTRSLEAVAADE